MKTLMLSQFFLFKGELEDQTKQQKAITKLPKWLQAAVQETAIKSKINSHILVNILYFN